MNLAVRRKHAPLLGLMASILSIMPVQAAQYTCVPIRASGVEGVDWVLGPGPNEITLAQGDQSVEIQVFISGFGTLNVTAYQARLDCPSLHSSINGEAVEIQDDCTVGGGDWGVDFCMGINEAEPTYILANASNALTACDPHLCSQNSGLACSAVAILGESGPDDGNSFYAMTFGFDITPDTRGTIELTLSSDPDNTFMLSGQVGDTPIDAINPALISIPVRACCGIPEGSLGCVDTTRSECNDLGGRFSDTFTCSRVDIDGDGVDFSCDLCPNIDDAKHAPSCIAAVPTTSSWGLIILSLCYLVGFKIKAIQLNTYKFVDR